MRTDVAALYVEADGHYPDLVEVWYDAVKDARTYPGRLPVVAHPPCGPWGRLKAFCTKQDKTLGPIGVKQVQQWGGVLEHPSHSTLFKHCNLPTPGQGSLFAPGFTVAVEQWHWGHKAIKPTWLYVVGCAPSEVPATPKHNLTRPWGGEGKTINLGTRSVRRVGGMINNMSSKQRRLSPLDFALWLLEIASKCRV